MTKVLTFREFQDLNRRRCKETFHKLTTTGTWGLSDWCLAIAGEAGELCNLVKKIRRGDFTVAERREEILSEIADIITYCDLTISSLGANTDRVIASKFDKVSKRVSWEGPRLLP